MDRPKSITHEIELMQEYPSRRVMCPSIVVDMVDYVSFLESQLVAKTAAVKRLECARDALIARLKIFQRRNEILENFAESKIMDDHVKALATIKSVEGLVPRWREMALDRGGATSPDVELAIEVCANELAAALGQDGSQKSEDGK